MTVHSIKPNQDRALSRGELDRMHTALLEAELSLDELPGWIPDDWIRIIQAPIAPSFARSGCYSVHLIAHENKRFRAYQAGLLDAPASRWWHRLTDWWFKW